MEPVENCVYGKQLHSVRALQDSSGSLQMVDHKTEDVVVMFDNELVLTSGRKTASELSRVEQSCCMGADIGFLD